MIVVRKVQEEHCQRTLRQKRLVRHLLVRTANRKVRDHRMSQLLVDLRERHQAKAGSAAADVAVKAAEAEAERAGHKRHHQQNLQGHQAVRAFKYLELLDD